MRSALAALAALAFGSSLAVCGPVLSQTADLGKLEVRLWYEETGRLSDNIAPPTDFAAWNIIIGEGDAEEAANDAVFVAEVLTDGEMNVPTPLVLTATASDGRVIASRTYDYILTSGEGRSYQVLWATRIGCAGDVTFTARIGQARRSTTVSFPCGE